MAAKLICCDECGYACQDGEGCLNPCCPANPSMSEDRKAQLRADHARHVEEERERKRLVEIRAWAINHKFDVDK